MNCAEKVTKTLISKKLTITFMESCTSGLLASLLTDTEGASAIFPGSFITYSNMEKTKAGVNPAIISKYGVYSKECAREMARAAKEYYNTEIAIGITGTTGNLDPNNPDSVQGECHFCIINGYTSRCYTICQNVTNLSRSQIKMLYAENVFNALLKMI